MSKVQSHPASALLPTNRPDVTKYLPLLIARGRALASKLSWSGLAPEDFAGDLTVGLLEAMPKHDPALLTESLYAFIIVERDCGSIIRHWRTQRRCPPAEMRSLNNLHDAKSTAARQQNLECRHDLGEFLSKLPNPTRRVALLLARGNCAFVQRRLKMTRSAVRHQVLLLKRLAEKAGLTIYLEGLQPRSNSMT